MSWKNNLKLMTIDPDERFEITCRKCGLSFYTKAIEIMQKNPRMKQYWLDEVEKNLKCRVRTCDGSVELNLTQQNKIRKKA